MSLKAVELDQRPVLTSAARLRYDAPTRSYVLLSPERGLRLNDCASEIVQRCNGELTVQQIASELVSACAGTTPGPAQRTPTAEEITKDVLELLVELRKRQLLFFDAVL